MKRLIRLAESLTKASSIYYHVTPTHNLKRIFHDGLIPRIGRRSKRLGERRPAVYLFPDIVSAEDAVGNWLGDEFPEDTRLALLAVTIPTDIEVETGADYERLVFVPIPPTAIQTISEDI